MVRDYSERRQSRTTQQQIKRPAVWPYVLLIILLMLAAFAAGLGTGWYLYRPGGRFYKAPPQPQPIAAPKKESALPPQGEPIAPVPSQNAANAGASATQGGTQKQPQGEKGGAAPPLTFYNTLQKGNKGLMGTGINHPKDKQPATALPPDTTNPPPTKN